VKSKAELELEAKMSQLVRGGYFRLTRDGALSDTLIIQNGIL
jgi:hypothetical protein